MKPIRDKWENPIPRLETFHENQQKTRYFPLHPLNVLPLSHSFQTSVYHEMFFCLSQYENYSVYALIKNFLFHPGFFVMLLLLLSWCLMSSDVIWHIRDKLWPMPKHGSIRKVHACLAVTCHLHFWQNDRDFLRATVVTRGWNGYRNRSQHRKSTLEKKILPPFQQGFEPATFQSRVRRSNHWAIPAPRPLSCWYWCMHL